MAKIYPRYFFVILGPVFDETMDIVRRHTDYAIRALVFLASAEDVMTSCTEVARECKIPKDFTHKVLKRMVNADFVTSSVGRAGGFRLSKDPMEISLGEVIEAVQGPIAVCRCVLGADACGLSAGCPVAVEWRKLQGEIVGFLERTTLHDVLLSACAIDTQGRQETGTDTTTY